MRSVSCWSLQRAQQAAARARNGMQVAEGQVVQLPAARGNDPSVLSVAAVVLLPAQVHAPIDAASVERELLEMRAQ